jgi:energy-coupling factor transporter ATP-binding protein EcfA2
MDPITLGIGIYFGKKIIDILSASAEDYAKDQVKSLFDKGKDIVLNRKDKKLLNESRDALTDTYKKAFTDAFAQTLDSLGKTLQLMVSADEMEQYRGSVEKFVKNKRVAEHLLWTIRNLNVETLPDPNLLEMEWKACGGKELPMPMVWQMVAVNFRKGAKERAFLTPAMREVLSAQNLDDVKDLLGQIRGIQVTVKHEQYVSVMRKTFAPVQLANITPSYADDPGQLVVTDIFEPQHVRENPPPVEITKEQLDKISRDSKPGQNNDTELIAQIEDHESKEAIQKLQFQQATYTEQSARPVLEVIAQTGRTNNRLMVITGEPGSGKSTLMRYLLMGILEPPMDLENPGMSLGWTEGFIDPKNQHFPLLIELRDYHFTCEQEAEVNSVMDYVRFLGEAMGYGIDDQWLDNRLKDGPSLIMFDGLDEIFDPARRDKMMKQIVGFSENYPKARIIVTSRPHGIREEILRPAGFVHYRLQDLERDQKERFTRAWFNRVFPNSEKDAKQRVDRVLSSVDRSPSVRMLAGNPMLLTIMCLIAREKELPRERARFYDQCIDVLVHQWDVNNHIKDENLAFLDVDDKKDLLRQIAFEMQGNNGGMRGNFIAERDLHKLTKEWVKGRFDDDTKARAHTIAKQIIEGLWHRNYLLCPRGPKLYGFIHRTFMEYLTAIEYVWKFEKTDDFKLDDLEAVFNEHGNDPEWDEVLRLICGGIGEEYAERLIRTLATLKPFPKDEIGEDNQPNHLALAIRCMGELRNLSTMDNLGLFMIEQCLNFLSGFSGPSGLLGTLYNFMRIEFFDAVSEVASNWPSKDSLLSKKRLESDAFQKIENYYIPKFHALVVRNRQIIEDWILQECNDPHRLLWHLSALNILAEFWLDKRSQHITTKCAIENKNNFIRRHALELLAIYEQWADNDTHNLITKHANEDSDEHVRSRALELLTRNKQWADDNTRELITKRANEDEHQDVRSTALGLLADNEQWADDNTRKLINKLASEDEHQSVRSTALELLTSNQQWADHKETLSTRQHFLEHSIWNGTDPKERGRALHAWFANVGNADPIYKAKRLVSTRDADGYPPYLDPHKPISDEHLVKVADQSDLSDDQLNQMVTEMNESLGWDIRKGYSPDTESKIEKSNDKESS